MTFRNLDFVIKRCEEHLDSANMRGTEIENYFVQYLLVRIWAEYEARITALLNRRCTRITDSHLKAFIRDAAKKSFRKFSIREIGDILDRFGSDYSKAFNDSAMKSTPQQMAPHIAWDNIYTNRNAVAHQAGAQMSLGDLKKNYAASLAVLDALVIALELRPAEMRAFK